MRSLDYKQWRNSICNIIRAMSETYEHGSDHHKEPIRLSHEVDSLNLALRSFVHLADKT
jgi:hypothetical protein